MPLAERPARRLIDFDELDGWIPDLSGVLSPHVPRSFERRAADAAPEFVEDALALLFESAAREAVIDATLDWIRSSEVAGYHGSRLTDEEVASVRSNGLVPLEANARRERLADRPADPPRAAGDEDPAGRHCLPALAAALTDCL